MEGLVVSSEGILGAKPGFFTEYFNLFAACIYSFIKTTSIEDTLIPLVLINFVISSRIFSTCASISSSLGLELVGKPNSFQMSACIHSSRTNFESAFSFFIRSILAIIFLTILSLYFYHE